MRISFKFFPGRFGNSDIIVLQPDLLVRVDYRYRHSSVSSICLYFMNKNCVQVTLKHLKREMIIVHMRNSLVNACKQFLKFCISCSISLLHLWRQVLAKFMFSCAIVQGAGYAGISIDDQEVVIYCHSLGRAFSTCTFFECQVRDWAVHWRWW